MGWVLLVVAATGLGGLGAATPVGAPNDTVDGSVSTVGASSESNARTAADPAGAHQTTNESGNVTIPAVDAMRAAQNETNGTAVGAELSRQGEVTDFERPTRVYAVDVVLANDTRVVVDVNASDGSIREVQRPDNETGVFEGLFGSDDGLPENRTDFDSVRSAIDAVELARSEAGENGTVTGVELRAEGDRLQYVVETVSTEGTQSSVVIAADPADGDVLTTNPNQPG